MASFSPDLRGRRAWHVSFWDRNGNQEEPLGAKIELLGCLEQLSFNNASYIDGVAKEQHTKRVLYS